MASQGTSSNNTNPQHQYGVHKILNKQINPYLGLGIQSVNASPNSAAKGQKHLLSQGVNGAYIKSLTEQDNPASVGLAQRRLPGAGSEAQRTSLGTAGLDSEHVYAWQKASQSAQKHLEKLRNQPEINGFPGTAGSNNHTSGGVQSQSQTSMK